MDKFANDNLILLEFLVDNVCFEYGIQKCLKCMPGETCVAFQFLDNAPLYVCEEDFSPKNRNYTDGCGGCSTMKNGKSCLFALNPTQAQKGMKQFDIYVEVFRKMKPGIEPAKVVLGESLISILNLFQEMVAAYNSSVDDEPIAKTLKDCFKIQNSSGELVGRIGVYIRMSTFGRLIVTQFQMNLKDKSVEFKAKEGHYMFGTKTKEAEPGKNQVMEESLSVKNVFDLPCGKPKESATRPCISEELKCPRPPPCPPPFASSPMDGMQNNTLFQSPVQCPPQCPTVQSSGQMQMMQRGPYRQSVSYGTGPGMGQSNCQPPGPLNPSPIPNSFLPPPMYPQSQYPPRPSSQCGYCRNCTPQCCPSCGLCVGGPNQNQMQMQAHGNGLGSPCNECDDPNHIGGSRQVDPDYQEFGAEMGSNALIIRVHKNNKARVDEVGEGDNTCCCEPGGKPKPAVYPVSQSSPSCPCSNQAAGGGGSEGPCPDCCPATDTPFTFKMGGTTLADNKVDVFSPTNNNAQNNGKSGVLADPTKEVFVLRIGKKNESSSNTNNLEIELCTPKGKGYKPAPPKMDRDQQCEAPAKPAKGKGKKGKGKGKGGKKGKKGKGKKKK